MTERPEPVTRTVEGDDLHLDLYAAPGPARGSVVLVPGMGAHGLLYGGFCAALSERGWNVVALDLRGHGRSGGPRGDFSVAGAIADMREAVAFARDRLDAPTGLLGSSLGGMWSLIGANAIEEVASAVSQGIVLPDMPVTTKDRIAKPIALALAAVAPRLRLPTRLLSDWDTVAEDKAIRDGILADPLMVWGYTTRAAASGFRYRPERPLTRLRCPHLLIVGENDGMTPAPYVRRVFERLEGEKELCVLPGAGHAGGLIEHRAEIVEIADAWFQRTLAASAAAMRPKTSAEASPLAYPPTETPPASAPQA